VSLLTAAALVAAGCASAPVWRGWSEVSQKQYFGLSCVASDSVLAEYRSLADQPAMDGWYRAYWASDRDGISYREHRRRLDRAWESFGGNRCFRDDRASTYLRYGEPTDRWTSREAWHYLDSKQLAGGAMFRRRPWEVWQYPAQGLSFDFIEFNEAYRTWATLRLDRRHPVAFFDTGGAPFPVVTAVPVHPLELGWARFKSTAAPGKVRWELYWRIPVAAAADGRAEAVFALSGAGGAVRTDTLRYRVVIPADPLPEPYAVGQRNLDLSPGRYVVDIAVRTDSAVFRARAEAELVAYRPGVQECSDAELALLQDTTLIADVFRKGKYLRVVPQVTDQLPTRQPYFVYYEVYNLRTDAAGNHRAAVRLQTFQAGEDTLTERPFAAGEFTSEEPGSEYRGCHCIYPRDLGAGETYLVVNVEDLLSGRTTKLIRTFRLKER
jgi:hypothetical protein